MAEPLNAINMIIQTIDVSLPTYEYLYSAFSLSTFNTQNIQLNRRFNQCKENNKNPFSSNANDLAQSIAERAANRQGRAGILNIRYAVSRKIGLHTGNQLGQSLITSLEAKEISKSQSNNAKNQRIWDVNLLTQFLQQHPSDNYLTWMQLISKVASLIILINAFRYLEMEWIQIGSVIINLESIQISLETRLKTALSTTKIILEDKNSSCRNQMLVYSLQEIINRFKDLRLESGVASVLFTNKDS
ncbi:MAG: hypothetical protein EZS28_022490 [Streblomastix strix]|uniref:Uncharacterized protein n=1 Tax=Streblomastix strix TaxID=222440 RepID=A0A5J4VI88_9EUKA|nr:MAG: hypothetical protein EZS28_022490 [Streblomastix strix]